MSTNNKTELNGFLPKRNSTLSTSNSSTSLDDRFLPLSHDEEEQSILKQQVNGITSISSYFQTLLFRKELLLCIGIYLFGWYSPFYLFRPLVFGGGVHERPIPYQVLNSGDVILDLSLNHEYVEDVTIPSKFLIHSSITVPLLIVLFFTLRLPLHPSSSFKSYNKILDTHSMLCVLFTTIGLSEGTTQIAKMYVGRLRPNFYQLCGFNIQSLQCEADEHLIQEARSSFPSGHSSLSFAGMGVLVWFFLGRYWLSSIQRVQYGQQQRDSSVIYKVEENGIRTPLRQVSASGNGGKFKAILCLLPWGFSLFTACSRLVDNWHHPSDIIAGSLIGIFYSTIIYHLWYPSVFSTSQYAGIPYILHQPKAY